MQFTLVSTVFNESKRLKDSLNDLSRQTILPSKCIIIDAGSIDNTVQVLKDWSKTVSFDVIIEVISGANVAIGRNRAIQLSETDIIVSTDFGCRYHENFLKLMITPFDNPLVDVVGGAYSVLEKDIISIWAKANFIITNGYFCYPKPGFIPSSRAIAYKKNVWEEAGKYPEWLTLAADDLVFGLVVINQNRRIEYVYEPVVFWGRHEKLKAYGKEAFRYGLGDGEAEVNKREIRSKVIETTIRYTSIFLIPIFLFYLNKFQISWLCLFLLTPFLLGFKSYFRILRYWWRLKSSKYNVVVLLACIPVIEITRIQYIIGYIKGYFRKTKQQNDLAKYWNIKFFS
jgi:glycosyltransferase involved in cell wall biosynthesis